MKYLPENLGVGLRSQTSAQVSDRKKLYSFPAGRDLRKRSPKPHRSSASPTVLTGLKQKGERGGGEPISILEKRLIHFMVSISVFSSLHIVFCDLGQGAHILPAQGSQKHKK